VALRAKNSTIIHEEIDMNWNHIEGEWKNLKGAIRAKWGKLTDDDYELIGGKKDQFVGKLQERYGYERDHAEREVDSFIAGMNTKPGKH
jgi:uncharacterized protein YjbJ (UPF0337 family)